MKTDPKAQAKRLSERWSRRTLLRAAVLGGAVLVALVAWLSTRGGDSSAAPEVQSLPPRIVSPAELSAASAELGQPIYWAGPIAGKELVLKELGQGRGVQVFYAPDGVAAGEASVKALTVGSYPLPNPKAALEGYAGRAGSRILPGSEGREIVTSGQSPTSAYFIDPGDEVQVEVYDPSPARATGLARSGRVQPAG
jgi:hypothetical protein